MKMVVCAVALLLGLGASAGTASDEIKASIKSGWRKMAQCSNEVLELRDGMKALPDKSFWFWETDKNDQRAKIRKELLKVRELLLSTNAQKLLEEVDEIDEDIAELDEDLREEAEKKALDPDAAKECDEEIAKLQAKRQVLQERRRTRAKVVCDELRALGLNVSGEAAEQCLFTVNFDDLIDGVVVSRNIAAVVENLREMMKGGDVVASRRYFGMYLTMVDVQVVCFEDYLEKSRNGAWRTGVNRILADARAASDRAAEGANDSQFTAEQRSVFSRNRQVNQATVRAAEAYLRVLDAHEAVIARKLETAKRIREVVENSYETVNLASGFLDIARSNQEAFDSLVQLELPPIETFNDTAVQQEFLSITRKLKE